MNILIIGGTSSVGKALVKTLNTDHKVITAGRGSCDIKLDLSDEIEEIHVPENLDVIIIMAAHFGGNSENDIYEAENVNVLGTLKVCQKAKKANCKHVVLISSIFSLLSKGDKNYSIYSLSKKHSEELSELFCDKYELPLTILRPPQLYGNIDNFHIRQPFLNMLLDKAEKGEAINIYGSRDPKINIMHIDDLVKIISLVIKKHIFGTYSCINPEDVSYGKFAKTAYQVCNQKEQINYISEYNDIPDNIFSYDDTLYEKIDYYPELDLQKGIERVYKHRKNIA